MKEKIGIVNATFFEGEVTELVTISPTTGNVLGTQKIEFTEAMAFVDYIEAVHRRDTYSVFIISSHGVHAGIIDIMKERDLPVLSVKDAFQVIMGKVAGDSIKSEPIDSEREAALGKLIGRIIDRQSREHGIYR